MTPDPTTQWLRDVLTELSAVANGYRTSVESAQRVMAAVPAEYLAAAGLARIEGLVSVAPAGTATNQTLAEALGHVCDGSCESCKTFRDEMAAIAEAERSARRG